MQPPKNANVIDWPNSIMWFDEDGILYSVSKKKPSLTLAEAKKAVEDFKKLTNGRKVCMLTDNTNSSPPSKELRDYVAEVMPDLVKAIAVTSNSAAGRMVANLFFSIKKQPYPIKMFEDETKAKKWLKQYL